jgi:hypothetical protein
VPGRSFAIDESSLQRVRVILGLGLVNLVLAAVAIAVGSVPLVR